LRIEKGGVTIALIRAGGNLSLISIATGYEPDKQIIALLPALVKGVFIVWRL
jgi:hypothetical protein